MRNNSERFRANSMGEGDSRPSSPGSILYDLLTSPNKERFTTRLRPCQNTTDALDELLGKK